MKNEVVIDGITVGGQPTADELNAGRFKAVVNIRRDEEPGNDTAALLEGKDVAYQAVPWTIETVTKDDIAAVRAAIEAAEGPVLVHWMGATRAAVAVSIIGAEKEGSGAPGAFEKMRTAGFDIDGTPYADFINRYFT